MQLSLNVRCSKMNCVSSSVFPRLHKVIAAPTICNGVPLLSVKISRNHAGTGSPPASHRAGSTAADLASRSKFLPERVHTGENARTKLSNNERESQNGFQVGCGVSLR